MVGRVLENRREELKALERDISKLEAFRRRFHRMSYDDAVSKLQIEGQRDSMGRRFRQHRRDAAYRRSGSAGDRGSVIPPRSKRFISSPIRERPELALGVDFIAPEGYGEIIGGGQRIHDLDLLLKRLEEHNLPREAFDWYLDLRKFGSVPHAGFGMGVERFVAWMCGLEHIRETIAFPRMLYRTRP